MSRALEAHKAHQHEMEVARQAEAEARRQAKLQLIAHSQKQVVELAAKVFEAPDLDLDPANVRLKFSDTYPMHVVKCEFTLEGQQFLCSFVQVRLDGTEFAPQCLFLVADGTSHPFSDLQGLGALLAKAGVQ